MPQYRAKSPGFMFGKQYAPGTKREVVTTDMPLKSLPSWLEPIIHETVEEADEAEREQIEREEAERQEAERKQAEARKDETDVTFVSSPIPKDHGNSAGGSNVESL